MATFLPKSITMKYALVSCVLLCLASLRAQCSNSWLPGVGIEGVDGDIYATAVWDPDGAGPATPRLLVGGAFAVAGNVLASNVASYDPVSQSWAPVAGGTDGPVRTLLPLASGGLVIGGSFAVAGGVPCPSIASLVGGVWTSLGSGTDGGVAALALLPSGDVVAGGSFQFAGGVACSNVARWNGSAWAPLGAGVQGWITSLTVRPNGTLVVGGELFAAGPVAVSCVAQWNGTSWAGLGTGVTGGAFQTRVDALCTTPNGDVYAGGDFSSAGGVAASNIARWNGTSWASLGTGTDFPVSALVATASGAVVVGGFFSTAGGLPAASLARWNGAWSTYGNGPHGVVLSAAVWANGDVYAAGSALDTPFGTFFANAIRRWNGTSWGALGRELDGPITSVVQLPNGDLVVGGWFTSIGGIAATGVARWNGLAWSPLGTGTDGPVFRLLLLPNGDLVVGGWFASAGGVAAAGIARWSGGAWSALGQGLSGGSQLFVPGVFALARAANGDVIAAGNFTQSGATPLAHVARWNGVSWQGLGSGTNDVAFDVIARSNGDIVAGGVFTLAGGTPAAYVAQWNGSSWSGLGAGVAGGTFQTSVTALAEAQNGDLVASGDFQLAGGVTANQAARWTSAGWTAMGPGLPVPASSLLSHPGGGLFAAGAIGSFPVPTEGVWRWDGSAWSPVAGLAGGSSFGVASVTGLALLRDGDVAACGTFATAGGQVAAAMSRLTTACPATAVGYGSGCSGAAGPITMTVTGLPWLGGVAAASASGLANGALGIVVRGLGQVSLGLPTLLPFGTPGCTLHVSPDLLDVVVPSGGLASFAFPLPVAPALIGQSLRMQTLSLEIGAGFAFTGLAGSSAVQLVLGQF